MGIRDDVGEISENNVTIAEKQEKVYNAGVRAGMMQDPDYSEGYEDGYEQGLSDSSGVVWEDLLSGKVPVGKAKEADHADKATNAENAEYAKNANHTKSADNATNANRATGANHATEADHSVEADHATEADRSVEADHATNADKANTAVSADHATTATVANSTNSFNGVLPIENGGTGASTATAALDNLGAASIVRGSYVGTGTSGVDNPNTLVFERPVKMLLLLPVEEHDVSTRRDYIVYEPAGGYSNSETNYYDEDTPIPLFGVKYRPNNYRFVVTRFDTTVSWYYKNYTSDGSMYADSEINQRNRAGVVYEYIAFLA